MTDVEWIAVILILPVLLRLVWLLRQRRR